MGKLFWKFFAFFLLAQLTAIAGVGFYIWVEKNNQDILGVETSRPARVMVEAATATLQHGGVKALTQLLKQWQTKPMPQVYAAATNNGLELLNRPLKADTFKAAKTLAEQGDGFAQTMRLSDGSSYLLFVPDIGRKLPRMGEPPPHKRGLFPFKPMLAGALASLVFAYLLAWYFSKPIHYLRNAFEQASQGKLDVRVGDAMGSRRDELADLGRDFDAMAARLGSLLQGQTRLLHHVSHELRSPLARMQMALGLARQNPDKIDASLTRIEREAVKMDTLVGELLELSRYESGVVQLKKSPVVLNQLLVSIVEDAQFEAQNKGITLNLVATQQIQLQAQPDVLYRAIENVVRNAIKYAPEQSEVTLDLQLQTNFVIVRVSDVGLGVAQSELEDIFKPFIRGTSGSQTEGHGVGLAITKQVVEAHGGSVRAYNMQPTGFCVEIALPL
jgi:two-component system, OmpR family, sensor kinase